MYALQVEEKLYGRTKEELFTLFTKEKIEVRPLWYLNHLQKPYRHCQPYNIKKAYELFRKTLNIPCSVGLTRKDIERIGALLKKWKK